MKYKLYQTLVIFLGLAAIGISIFAATRPGKHFVVYPYFVVVHWSTDKVDTVLWTDQAKLDSVMSN